MNIIPSESKILKILFTFFLIQRSHHHTLYHDTKQGRSYREGFRIDLELLLPVVVGSETRIFYISQPEPEFGKGRSRSENLGKVGALARI